MVFFGGSSPHRLLHLLPSKTRPVKQNTGLWWFILSKAKDMFYGGTVQGTSSSSIHIYNRLLLPKVLAM
jgi:hypothetical protein